MIRGIPQTAYIDKNHKTEKYSVCRLMTLIIYFRQPVIVREAKFCNFGIFVKLDLT